MRFNQTHLSGRGRPVILILCCLLIASCQAVSSDRRSEQYSAQNQAPAPTQARPDLDAALPSGRSRLHSSGKPVAPIHASFSADNEFLVGIAASGLVQVTASAPVEIIEVEISARSGAVLHGGPILRSLTDIRVGVPSSIALTLTPDGDGPARILFSARARSSRGIEQRSQLLSVDVVGTAQRRKAEQGEPQRLPDGSAYIPLRAEELP